MIATNASMNIGEALTRLYKEHDLPPDGGEHEALFHVRIGPITIPLPNPPARQRAVFIHDVNHLLTGYNAIFSDGEMSIAAYEIGTGCGRVWVAWLLNLWLMALAAFVKPKATFHAFVRGRQADSLYLISPPRAELRAMSVGDVRSMIRLDEQPLAPTPADYVRFVFWVAVTWLVSLSVLAALLAGISWIAVQVVGLFMRS